MDKPERDRGGVIPLGERPWWPAYAMEAVLRRAKERAIRAPGWRELAQELVAAGVATANDDKVRRCVKGEVVTWEIAIPLSRLLGILPPAFVAETLEQAEAMNDRETLDEAQLLLRKARKLALRIAGEKGQTATVKLVDDHKERDRARE